MIRYHARWVLPIASAPIPNGAVLVDDGRIAAVEQERRRERDASVSERAAAQDIDLGDTALLPGLVNAHTHLELSYLRDVVPPAAQFVDWIRGVMSARRQRPDPNAAEILDAAEAAIADTARTGTAVVGDISNTLAAWNPLARSPIAGVVFYELIKFNPADPDALVDAALDGIDALSAASRLRASLAAHAPYSVAPDIFHAIRRVMAVRPAARCSVHLSESAEEVEFIDRGSGAWRTLLDDVGAWNPSWMAPGVTPVAYLDEAGFLDDRVLAVHGVQMDRSDLQRLARRGTTLVTCPRSNAHTGAGAPPLADFFESGVPIAIGTDSLASAPDLSVFAELATIRALAPEVPARRLLESATRIGARALGFDADYGTIEVGKRARLLAVAIPPSTEDVEEYLVSGVDVGDVRWVG